ncbi:Aste57867_2016 [Aphanomyces stellatus]|uniref:Aste57867_2016 protein n=1 Tax=Aphanomyces stellatus TaxID=120398 RepID=A0A485K805_9STRA|nr:hypothetical protein As57867_002013 [Aphanomyces stellatus]VFT79220.1 Aste57867_2016 [Aphanomyces stellatus]
MNKLRDWTTCIAPRTAASVSVAAGNEQSAGGRAGRAASLSRRLDTTAASPEGASSRTRARTASSSCRVSQTWRAAERDAPSYERPLACLLGDANPCCSAGDPPAAAAVQVVYGFQEVPKAPSFNGSTKVQMRRFMDQYEPYAREVNHANAQRPGGAQIQRVLLSACIDPLAVERIAYWEIGKPSHEVTEED